MTTLAIIPDYENKRLEFSGTVAAGEHVAVSIVGGSEWAGTGSALRLRVLFGGKMVAVFPYWTDENEDDWPDEVVSADAWDTTGDDPTCTLVLNTIQAEKMLRRGGECLWILDDTENHTLYGMGLCHVEPWPKNLPSDVPYNLDGYPDFVKDAKQAILDAQAAISEAVDEANGIVAYVTSAKNSAQAAATNAGAFKDQAETAASNAGDFKTLAETAKTGAEAAQTAAETAQGKAEDAQAAAEAVQVAVENKADKVSPATVGNLAALDDDGNLTDSGKSVDSFAEVLHQHTMNDVEGLVAALAGKGDVMTLANIAIKVATLIGSVAGDDALSVREIVALVIAASANSGVLANKRDKDDLTYGEDFWFAYNESRTVRYVLVPYDNMAWRCQDVFKLLFDSERGEWTFVSWNDFYSAQVWDDANATSLTFTLNGVTYSLTKGNAIVLKTDLPTRTSQLTNDSSFLTAHQNISGKLDGVAAYPAWSDSQGHPAGTVVSHNGRLWHTNDELIGGGTTVEEPSDMSGEWYEITVGELLAEKQEALSAAQLANIAAVPNKAAAADLPYALVEPGKWSIEPTDTTFHGNPIKIVQVVGGGWQVFFDEGGGSYVGGISQSRGDASSLRLEWAASTEWAGDVSIVATRPSLPGHLCDRACNVVSVSSDTTLVLPAAIPGHLRDFLVRLEFGTLAEGATLPSVTFSAPTGETIVYEADGDEFPVPDSDGNWLYYFSESKTGATGHFAVGAKKLNVVTQSAEGGT